MKDIKIVAMEFYFACPEWLAEDRSVEVVRLSGECTGAEVDVLLYGLIGYNHLPLAELPEGSLLPLIDIMNRKETAMPGGLLFQEDEKIILPGCCCGMEQWQEIAADIEAKKTPWLGHDPFVDCTFEDGLTVIHSDGPDSVNYRAEDVITISFTAKEIEYLLRCLKRDMDMFASGPLMTRINELIPQSAEAFHSAWRNCFCKN